MEVLPVKLSKDFLSKVRYFKSKKGGMSIPLLNRSESSLDAFLWKNC